jgi:hypothetical protein
MAPLSAVFFYLMAVFFVCPLTAQLPEYTTLRLIPQQHQQAAIQAVAPLSAVFFYLMAVFFVCPIAAQLP